MYTHLLVKKITNLKRNLQPNAAIRSRDVIQKLFGILADDRFFVVASNVVPSNTVVVNIIEDGQTCFTGLVDVEFGIVGLSLLLVSSRRPRVVVPTVWWLVGRRHLLPVRGPEPTVEAFRFQIRTVFATLEVAEPSRCPDVRNVI